MTNITLIGMSGAGKSSVGEILAKDLGFDFIDIDKIIETSVGQNLQDFLDKVGEEEFGKEEVSQVGKLRDIKNSVISPGGSVVYWPEALDVLKQISKIFYLSIDPTIIEERVDVNSRGIVGLKNKTFQELFAERKHLYEKYADFIIRTDNKNPEEVAKSIMSYLY